MGRYSFSWDGPALLWLGGGDIMVLGSEMACLGGADRVRYGT